MKTASLSALVLASCGSLTEAISVRNREQAAAPRVLQFDTQKNHVADPVARDRRRMKKRDDAFRMRKRDNTFMADLTNEKTLYYLNATIGTPGQDVRLHIDTGSSDLWVNVPDSNLCQSSGSPCETEGTFNPDDSSTYSFVNDDFNITYADGSQSIGDYGTDTLRIGDVSVKDMQFGLGLASSTPDNILGIGYTSNEALTSTTRDEPYANLPVRLAEDGTISATAYSLWLNDLDSSSGSIMFGGVDSNRYTGDLVTFPIQKIEGNYYEFFVTLTGFTYNGDELGKDMALAVLLDSGSSLAYLPRNIVEPIYNDLDVSVDSQTETPFVDCSVGQQDIDLTFTFGELDIKIPMSEMVINTSEGDGQLTFPDGTPACLFGLAPSGGSSNVLGDTFLRSAYVVYDLNNNEISLAQTKFDAASKSSDIAEITKNEAVPGATKAKDPKEAQSGLPGQKGQNGQIGNNGGDPSEDDGAGMLVPSSRGAMLVACAAALFSFGGLLL